MKLNERHLMQLAAVLDADGVSEGAALLGLTQPAVSRSLSQLEARVGAPLFVKGRRPLQPTPLGLQLAAYGRTIMAASREASLTVRGFVRGSKGLVRIGGAGFVLDALVSRMVGAFQVLEPEIIVHQTAMPPSATGAALEAGQLDLGLVVVGEAVHRPGFRLEPLLQGNNIIACRSGHPLTRSQPVAIGDLAAFPWISPSPGSPLMVDLHTILTGLGISEHSIRYAGGSLLSLLHYLAETDALAVLPLAVAHASRAEGRLAVLPCKIPQPKRHLSLMRYDSAPQNPAADRLADYLGARFTDLRETIRTQPAG